MTCRTLFFGNGSTQVHWRDDPAASGAQTESVEQHFAVNPLYCGDGEGNHFTVDTEVLVRASLTDGTDDALGVGAGARYMRWDTDSSFLSGEVRAGVDVMTDAIRPRLTAGVGLGVVAFTVELGVAYLYETKGFVPDLSVGIRYGF